MLIRPILVDMSTASTTSTGSRQTRHTDTHRDKRILELFLVCKLCINVGYLLISSTANSWSQAAVFLLDRKFTPMWQGTKVPGNECSRDDESSIFISDQGRKFHPMDVDESSCFLGTRVTVTETRQAHWQLWRVQGSSGPASRHFSWSLSCLIRLLIVIFSVRTMNLLRIVV